MDTRGPLRIEIMCSESAPFTKAIELVRQHVFSIMKDFANFATESKYNP